MAVLMLSVFTVSMGFGVLLPLLPYLVERLLVVGEGAAEISRTTGLLTGLYMLSLFAFAPLWGRLSDRYGRRRILVVGLVGFSAAMLTFAFIERLAAMYLERFVSGMFAAAVVPVALAVIGDLATTEEARARRLTLVGLAGISGFLVGPMLGAVLAESAVAILPAGGTTGSQAVPLVGTAVLALLAAAALVLVPSSGRGGAARKGGRLLARADSWPARSLLFLSLTVSAGVAAFEVGVALRGKQELGLSQYQVALMFTACSVVMFVVQAIVFSPLIRPGATRWLIAPALVLLAAGIVFTPYASDFTAMLIAVGAVAASAGIASPILTYWISKGAGGAQGAELGKQTAAASLGAALGSVVGGLLFEVSWLPNASFLIMAVLTAFGAVLSLGLPSSLARQGGRIAAGRR
jgi:MFS family permease